MCNSTTTNEHKLFALIREEHAVGLKKIDSATTTEDKKKLLPWLWHEVENTHHLREELFLFSAVLNKPGLREGGPYCVLYFDEHITNRPEQQSLKITHREPTWLKHQNLFKQNQSPIDIPLEEHRSMRSILEHLISNGDTLPDEQFHSAFSTYVKLYKHHTKKEEQCFFCVCQRLLSSEELDQIYDAWTHHIPTDP